MLYLALKNASLKSKSLALPDNAPSAVEAHQHPKRLHVALHEPRSPYMQPSKPLSKDPNIAPI